jgi:hypothetical protein
MCTMVLDVTLHQNFVEDNQFREISLIYTTFQVIQFVQSSAHWLSPEIVLIY